MQHCSITQTTLAYCRGRVQQSLELSARKVVDEFVIGLLHRDRVYGPCLVQAGHQAIFQIAEERFDRSKSRIPRLRGVVPLCLKILQELKDVDLIFAGVFAAMQQLSFCLMQTINK